MNHITVSVGDKRSKFRFLANRRRENIKEMETMENNKVRQFIDLLVNEEETIENAAKVSGIGDMKLVVLI